MKILKIVSAALVVAFFLSCNGQSTKKAVEDVELNTERDSVSYSIGLSIAESLKRDNMEDINPRALLKAFYDMKEGNEYAIEQSKIRGIISKYQSRKKSQQQKANMEKSQQFLKENKKKEGFKVTESGLQYKVLEEGSGESPEKGDQVKVHYKGTLADGEVFDSSYERGKPASFGVGRVIEGWGEALKMMKVGSKWKVVIPPELGYGKKGTRGGRIGPNEVLIFEMELLDVMEGKKQQPSKRQKLKQKLKQQQQQQQK